MQVIWLILFISSTAYSYYWDIWMDWNLGSMDRRFFMLRERRLFTKNYYYYGAIVIDLVLRFVWSTTLLPNSMNPFVSMGSYFKTALLTPLFGALELLRRGKIL